MYNKFHVVASNNLVRHRWDLTLCTLHYLVLVFFKTVDECLDSNCSSFLSTDTSLKLHIPKEIYQRVLEVRD